MEIKLKFINRSDQTQSPDVVFYQTNRATDFEELPVAWKVIKHCGFGNYHPFVFPYLSEVSASDSYGNFTPHLACFPGQAFQVIRTASGNELKPAGKATSVLDMELRNELVRGAINANIFKGGSLFARKTIIAPGQKAVFRFNPTLFVGAASAVEEGAAVSSAVIGNRKQELPLLGVRNADLILTGGGSGPYAEPFRFTLENIQWA